MELTDIQQELLHKLIVKGNTQAEIAKIFSIDDTEVWRLTNYYFPHLKDLSFYKEHKTDIFNSIQKVSLESIFKKIDKASLKDLTNLVGVLEDKINIRENRNTSNIGINIRIEDIVDKRDSYRKDIIEKGYIGLEVEKKLIEQCSIEHSAIPLEEVVEAVFNSPDVKDSITQTVLTFP